MRATRRTRLGGAGDPDSLSPPAESHWEWDAPHSRRKAVIPGPVLLMTAHRAMRDVKIPRSTAGDPSGSGTGTPSM